MRIVELCYAKGEHRALRNETARNEIQALGFERVRGTNADYCVPESRIGEIEAVVADLNEKYGGSLWLCWS